MSVPSIVIDPCSGLSRPTRDLRNTDLPVPEGPSSTLISPGGRVSVTSDQMFCLPNDLVSSSTTTSVPISDLLKTSLTQQRAGAVGGYCRVPAAPAETAERPPDVSGGRSARPVDGGASSLQRDLGAGLLELALGSFGLV